jgi:hypothetical protein
MPNQPIVDKEEQELNAQFEERLKQLPKVVQDAITSADVQKRLRELSDKHKLHLDQWELLENEVKLALLGFEPAEDLEKNIEKEVGVSAEIAGALAEDISTIVFEPIREELERSLDNPQAKNEKLSDVEKVREQVLAQAKPLVAAPATPPPVPSEEKAVRAPISEAYKAGEPSTVRKSVHDDPYREPPA